MGKADIVQAIQLVNQYKAAGLTDEQITKLADNGLLNSKTAKSKMYSVNGQPFEDVTLESGLVVKAPRLHMDRDGDFIKFSAKGFKPRAVSIDDLRAGWEDLEAGRILDVSKAGVRFVGRQSSIAAGKERKLGENLIIPAKNAGFF